MILRTTNYEIFKKHPSNRDIDPFNLKKVLNSIKSKNLLELRPITVNKKMQIIDGQHRLEAAKSLGIEVFYMIASDGEDHDIILLNAAQKRWTLIDYVNFFANQGDSNYKRILDFCNKNGLEISECISLWGVAGGMYEKMMREGVFDKDIRESENGILEKFHNIQQIQTLIDEKVMGKKLFLKSRGFKRGLNALMSNRGFSMDLFLQKLQYNISRVHACTTGSQYFEMFKSIYNYRNNDPIE